MLGWGRARGFDLVWLGLLSHKPPIFSAALKWGGGRAPEFHQRRGVAGAKSEERSVFRHLSVPSPVSVFRIAAGAKEGCQIERRRHFNLNDLRCFVRDVPFSSPFDNSRSAGVVQPRGL